MVYFQELEVVVGRYLLICCLPMTIRFYFLGHSQILIFSLANPPHNLNFTTISTKRQISEDDTDDPEFEEDIVDISDDQIL